MAARIGKHKLNVTPEEIRLRQALEKEGLKVEAQKLIELKDGRNCHVDLFVEDKLIVEVGFMSTDDIVKTERLTSDGHVVFNVSNEEVTKNVRMVVDAIKRMVNYP